MRMTDLVEAIGNVQHHKGDVLSTLLTRTHALKKSVGKAHKGWTLVCVANTTATSAAQGVAEARELLCQMLTSAGPEPCEPVVFVFARRVGGVAFFWKVRQ